MDQLDKRHTIQRAQILTANICAVSSLNAARMIEELIDFGGGGHYVCLSNVHTVMTCFDDPEFRRITNQADLALPDGMPLVWVLRSFGYEQPERVYGPDLMLTLCRRSVNKGYSHFLYGGVEDVNASLIEKFSEWFPGIKIAGGYSPPFRSLTGREDQEVVDMINQSKADILWVGLGAPKQEHWMASHVGRITVPMMLGVGAAFDFHAGLVKQAPHFIQQAGLEWMFRLLMEPKRLWKRYLYNNPRFMYHAGKEIILHHIRSNKRGKKRLAPKPGT